MFKLFFMSVFTIAAFANELFVPLPEHIDHTNGQVVTLGKELFFDPILSKYKDVSCFSCHFHYGADTSKVSLGTNGQEGFINSPSIFNIKYNVALFWNGRSNSLEEQMLGPLNMKHEMGIDKQTLEKRLNNSPKYQNLFQKAFRKKPSLKLVLEAISEYEKTLITPNSKFDKFLRGEVKLSKKELQGFQLFNTLGCVACHNGINIGGNSFQEFGTIFKPRLFQEKLYDRYSYTKKESDIGVYKVPSLRNVFKTAPYFHTGEIKTLKIAIKMMGLYNLGRILTDKEIDEIESFLNTLTGELPRSFQNKGKNR